MSTSYGYGRDPNRSYGGGPSYYGTGPTPSYAGPHSQSFGQPAYGPPASTMGVYEPREKPDSGFATGVKMALIALNIVFFLISGAGVGVGIWIILERDFMSPIYKNVLMTTSAYLMVVCGGILFQVSILGCLGSFQYRRHKCLLMVYLVFVITISVFLFIGAILSVVFRTQVQDSVQYQTMRESLLENYGVELSKSKYNKLLTQSWDQAQRELHCCAVEDEAWIVYQSSEWYKSQPGSDSGLDNEKQYVPPSCCQIDQYGEYRNLEKCQNPPEGYPPRDKGGKEFNEALNYRGCFEAGKEHVERYTGILIGMSIGAVALLVGAILCAFFLVCSSPGDKYTRT